MAKKIVPKKNIEPVILDVKKPDFNYERIKKSGKLNLKKIPQATASKFPKIRKMILAALAIGLALILIFVILVIVNLNSIKSDINQTSGRIMGNFTSSASALKEFEPEEAVKLLKENNQSLTGINDLVRGSAGKSIFETIGSVVPIIKSAFGFIGQVTGLNVTFLELAQKIQELQMNGFKYFQSDGRNLIALLESVHGLIGKMNDQTQEIKNNTSNLKNLSPFFDKIDRDIGDQYLKYSSDLYNWDGALANLIALIGSPADRHILIFFQNPSEIRPGGGFIGSYADVTLESGQMRQMDVRDIYDPDGQLDLKIIPPLELQTLTPGWGARDANWFFDFPTSAKTVIRFMETSKMYSEKNITFDAAVALNINTVKTLLGVTGPIDLPEYKLAINEDNLLYEVQKSVEAGADKKAGEPKKILKALAPLLLQKMGELSANNQKDLFDAIKGHVEKKDVMFYAKDPVLASSLATNGLDGGIFNLPNGFWGSYLAVVNANVAGGKSDTFTEEKVAVNIDLDTNGNSFTDVQVSRTHNGDKEKDPWWKAPNNNFIQIFTEPGSTLVSVTGNDVKPKYQTMDYANLNYAVYPDLAAIEKTAIFISNYKTWTLDEFGKNVFATWLMLKAGETKTLNVRYQTPYNNPTAFGPDRTYTFIFERQAGVKNFLDVTINAPFRYYWAESNDAAFHYATDDPDKRIILTLTLKKKAADQ